MIKFVQWILCYEFLVKDFLKYIFEDYLDYLFLLEVQWNIKQVVECINKGVWSVEEVEWYVCVLQEIEVYIEGMEDFQVFLWWFLRQEMVVEVKVISGKKDWFFFLFMDFIVCIILK